MQIRLISIPQILEGAYKIACWGVGKVFSRLCEQYEEFGFFDKIDVLIDQKLGESDTYYEYDGIRKKVYTAQKAAEIVEADDILLITCMDFFQILEQAMSLEVLGNMDVVVYSLVRNDYIMGRLFDSNRWIERKLVLNLLPDVKAFELFLTQLLMIYQLDYTGIRFHYFECREEKISPCFNMGKTTCRLEGEWYINPLEQFNDMEWIEMCRKRSEDGGYRIFFLPHDGGREQWYKEKLKGLSYTCMDSIEGVILVVIDQYLPAIQTGLDIFVVSHKQFIEVDKSGYRTIYVGGYQRNSNECLMDCTGENIADLNEKINECTALYWIWKNTCCEYVGLNHYRRYFCNIGSGDRGIITEQNAVRLLNAYDMLVAQKLYVSEDTLYDQLRNTVQYNAYEVGKDIIIRCIKKNQPEYLDDFEQVFSGKFLYPCNMFLTRRVICDQYCGWLFSIIIEAANEINVHSYDTYSRRIIGFFAERLLTVWLRRQKLRIGELPVIIKE